MCLSIRGFFKGAWLGADREPEETEAKKRDIPVPQHRRRRLFFQPAGLQYNRVEYVPFDTGIFLNLSPDHVSPTEHHSFEEYKEAKKRMLTLCRRGIVNLDDRYAYTR